MNGSQECYAEWKKNQQHKDYIFYGSASVTFSKQLKYGDGKPILVREREKEVSVALKESHKGDLPGDGSSMSWLW